MKKKNKQGFTLVELMVVVGILAVAISAILQLFIYTSVQGEMAGNKSTAISKAQTKMEEIRKEDFDDIVTNYASGGTPGNTFALTQSTDQLVGTGSVYVDSSNTELLVLKVVVSWQNKYGRVVGEDQDLDGTMDAGEDLDGDGEFDSTATLISMITRR